MKSRLAMVLVSVLAVSMLMACTKKTGEYTDTYKEETDQADTDEEETDQADTEEKSPNPEERKEDILSETVGRQIDRMTAEEKVAQLFIIQPEALMKDAGTVTAAGEMTRDALNETPVGGFIYLDENLESRGQVKEMLKNVQAFSIERTGLPMFLCVDEEGGAVARIAGSGRFDVPQMEDMSVVGSREDTGEAYEIGKTIGDYLSDMGFNVDFAPVADVLTNPENQVVKRRAFSADPKTAAAMAAAVAKGLEDKGVCAVYKHFPGHGGTAADTHEGYAYVDKSLEELKSQDLLPFQEAISSGAKVIMVGHISLPKVTGGDTPSSMSPEIITGLLRTQMDYDGIVVTDALNMGAVTEQHTSGQAAVRTILAGSDLVLMPEDFEEAYQGVLDAVNDGTISKERLDESLRRILRIKISMMDREMN